MPIRYVCPVCWTVRDGIDDALLGKMVKCQDCHAMGVAQHTPEPNASSAHQIPTATPPQAIPTYPVQPSPNIPLPTALPETAKGSRVVFSTGDIPKEYEIIDLIFAHGNSSEGAMKGAPPLQAFQMLVNWLGQTAQQIGANAVINIRLDYRILHGQSFLGPKQEFEVYGYGTAVKIKNDKTNG